MAKWIERPGDGRFDLEVGMLRLCVSDQRYRGCGWVWHISFANGETVRESIGFESADGAKAAVCSFVRWYFGEMIADIAEAEAA